MASYYSQKLSADRLRMCYEIASPRVKQYLEAEIEFVMDKVKPSDVILELGCGYDRVLSKLHSKAKIVVGVDTALQQPANGTEIYRMQFSLSSLFYECRRAWIPCSRV